MHDDHNFFPMLYNFCFCCNRATQLLGLSHVRLDREKISEIDNLDCLGPVTHLYLQKVWNAYLYLFVLDGRGGWFVRCVWWGQFLSLCWDMSWMCTTIGLKPWPCFGLK